MKDIPIPEVPPAPVYAKVCKNCAALEAIDQFPPPILAVEEQPVHFRVVDLAGNITATCTRWGRPPIPLGGLDLGKSCCNKFPGFNATIMAELAAFKEKVDARAEAIRAKAAQDAEHERLQAEAKHTSERLAQFERKPKIVSS